MANEVGIVTDSITCLNKHFVNQNGMKIVPISFTSKGKVYRDWIDVTPAEAYELFLEDPKTFATSPPAPMDYIEAYRELGRQGKDILCITISAKLSNMYNVARDAMEQVREEFPSVSIEVFDSQTTTAAEGFVALAAARAATDGMNLAEVIKVAEDVRSKVSFIILLDTIRHVYRSGRIPRIASQIGSVLNIKPILITSGGLIHFAGAVRKKEQGIKYLIKMLRSRVGDKAVHIAVMHAYDPEGAERLREIVASQFNCAELWITEFSPVMGYVCGTGTVGFAFYKD